jgi:hypothetical protein
MSDIKTYRHHSVWVAFKWDFSSLFICDDEGQARRHAEENHLEVRNVPFGVEVRNYLLQLEGR